MVGVGVAVCVAVGVAVVVAVVVGVGVVVVVAVVVVVGVAVAVGVGVGVAAVMNPFNPRSSYIYVERRTRRRLHLIAGAIASDNGRINTPDEVADKLLNEIIESKYPKILEIEKQIAGIEQDLAKALSGGKAIDP